MLGQRLRCRLGIGAATANGSNAAVGLDDVALAAEQECLFLVRDQQQGFEVAQKFVGAPVFCQLDRAPSQVAVILLQLRFEAAEKGESVGRRASKSSQDLVLV